MNKQISLAVPNMTKQQVELIKLGLIAAGVIYVGYKLKQGAAVAEKAVEEVVKVPTVHLNPVNHDNIFNRAANSLTRAVTGDPGATLGSKIFDVIHGEPEFKP